MHIAGCKALGLCSKLFTAPFLRLIEFKGNILDMNDHYRCMMTFLEEVPQNPIDFSYGISCPFPNLVQKDNICEILISPNEALDMTVQSLLMVIFNARLNYLKSVHDHLPEGKLCETSEQVKEICASVAKHNKFPERVFGLTDSLIRLRPNATEMCNEAFNMFTNNKTNAWLKSKREKERLQLLKDAHQLEGKLREQYKQ